MKRTLLLAGLALFSSLAAAEEIVLDSVVVESSTIEDIFTDPKTEVSTVNVIDEKKIEIIDAKNINEILRTVPGITADVRNGDVVEIHMRGVAQQEFMWEDTGVAIVIDGVPVLQNGGKVKFNLDEIESIKVIKGGASYLYGPNALAGAVIITTKKPKNRNEVSVEAEYGSYAYQNYKATAYKSTDQYAANVIASYRYTGGYWDMSENWTKSASGKFTYFIDEMSDITVGVDVTRKYEESSRGSVTGVTAAETNPTGKDDADLPWNHDYYSDIDKYFITYNKDFDNGANLMVNTYYYVDLYDFEASPQDLNGDGFEDTYTRDSSDDIYQKGIKSEYRANIDNLAYMVGLDIGQRELKSYDLTTKTYTSRGKTYYTGEWTDSDSTEDRYGLYGEVKYKLNPKWTIVANARYDYDKYEYASESYDFDGTVWTLSNITRDDSFRNVSYRVGATYQLNADNTLYTNISTGFRNPRIYELYAYDFDPDRYSQNNPDIDTETTINYEIGIRGTRHLKNNKFEYEVTLYQLDTKDIIARNGGTYYSNGSNVYFDNVGDARSRGLEFSVKSDRSKKLAFDLAYTYLDAYYTSHLPFTVDLDPIYRSTGDETYDIDGNQLPRTPHHKIDLFTYIKMSPKWTLIPEWYWQSSYYADETNFVKMPSYGVLNLQARYNTKINGNDFEFFARVDNFFDNQYYRTVYLYSDKSGDGRLDAEDASITVDPGRVYYVGMKYRF
ncbi:TonB-dependent receptor [Nitrosophilus alvini]|uniref:TonB-dependent receptor n=1 Tax=Nitrosophilus alvini TaxID=2714855 RepID=UPI00190A833F|nr:TonB-dependent receptor [Nitrosophilus alvini]